MSDRGGGLTGIGKLISIVLIAGVVGLGLFIVFGRKSGSQPTPPADSSAPVASASASIGGGAGSGAPELVETKFEVPRLAPAGVYTPKGDTIDVGLSEYAGYAGLIAANGGLEPSEQSVFYKKHQVKVRIRLTENEKWSDLASGILGVTSTTVDTLAVYGRSLGALVPVQLGFSRGADGIVVRSDVKRINHLKGRVLVAPQFTISDFFIRFLAQEAGLRVNLLPDLKATPDPEKVNLVFAADAKLASEALSRDIQAGSDRLAGCVSWAPFTGNVVRESGGKAHLLTTSRNLLVLADILLVNKAFAEQQPRMVAALVDGLLEGNRMVRENPEAQADVIAKAFKWKRDDVLGELAQIHFSNLPENLAFFSGDIDAAGSFGGIYQSAVLAYGPELIKHPTPEEKLLDLKHLKALEASGAYKDQKIAISPIKSGGEQALEADPLLSKDIRFYFEPNSTKLDLDGKDKAANEKNLTAIKKMLQVSPGSTILLRGHVDNSMVAEFRRLGGDQMVNKMTLEAAQLSKNRAEEVRSHLVKRGVDAKRTSVYGVGWQEPVSTVDTEQNRRVEVHWFTLE
jgi:NitT/TauT family transport system substrate-binding protein